MRLLVRLVVAVLVVVGLAALVGIAVLLPGGISARPAPGRLETAVAGKLRSFAIPRAAHEQRNLVPPTAEALRDGMAHFADHCAVCHANDGSGNTEMGRGLYPRAPDMRQETTQSLSDGALFYIIENGVRFTGMPAWGTGTAEGERASWHLVHFVRRLPELTDRELAEMREMNPKSAEEWREEEETRRFLQPEGAAPPALKHEHPRRER